MSCLLRVAAVAATFAALPVQAQWTPQWISAWQYAETPRAADVRRLRVDAAGATFAAVDLSHHGRAHDALLRFNADGSFAWLRESVSLGPAAVELLPGGRVALLATSATPGATIDLRVHDAASGELLWSRSSNAARLHFDERDASRPLAVDAAGNLLVAAADDGDFVVLRHTSDGSVLPVWRAPVGQGQVRATAILALADGGAVVSGPSDTIGGGFRTLRFNAAGAVLFDDAEAGDIGNPLGPAHLVPAADGGFLVAAAPESSFGMPEAMVWKLSADGARLWTVVLPNLSGNPASSLEIRGLAATRSGDALVVVNTAFAEGMRLLRLRGSDGRLLRQTPSATAGYTTGLALATSERVLVSGYVFTGSSGMISARIAEFDPRGAPCRSTADLEMSSAAVAIGSDGAWRVGGPSNFVQDIGSDALLRRYDADGVCTDAIFGDGLD